MKGSMFIKIERKAVLSMKKGIKKYIVYVLAYVFLSAIYLAYYYIKHSVINWDYVHIAVISLLIYTVMYYLLILIFGWRD